MTFDKIMTALRKKEYVPIYFLMGEEPYYIDQVSDYITSNVLTEAEQSFNQTVLYGKDTDVPSIITLARRFPMMADYQVVIIKEAQNLKKVDDLVLYVENPQNKTILVVNYKYGTINKTRKLYKRLAKSKDVALLESKKLYDNQVPGWIQDFLKKQECSTDPASAQLLADYLGNNLAKISNELNKLILTLPQGSSQITGEHIEHNIGISKDYNTFEFNNALARKDKLKAYRIANYFGANQKEHPLVLTLSSLYYFFSKLLAFHYVKNKSDNKTVASVLKVNPFFLKEYRLAAKNYNARKVIQIISLLREYDVRSKGIDNQSATPADLLKEMTYRILH